MTFNWDRFREVPIVAILRGVPPVRLRRLVEAIRQGGLTSLEITMNSEDAAGQIQSAMEASDNLLNIGAGTVTSVSLLRQALAAGASFVVTPVVQGDVIGECVRQNIPVFPGACSPTEVRAAWEQGASLVKVFPADTLGPQYLRTLKETFPEVQLLPTGGIDLKTLPAYRSAGADAFGIGSPLFKKSWIEAEDWNSIEQRCRDFRELLKGIQAPVTLMPGSLLQAH